MFCVGSDSDFVGSEGGNFSEDSPGVDLTEAGGHDAGADVDGGVVPVDESFLWVEVDEKVGIVADCGRF